MNSRNERGQFLRNRNRWEERDGMLYCYLGEELLFFTEAENKSLFEGMSVAKMANGYSAVNVNGVETAVHRIISKPAATEIVDHINRNKKDNRSINLRNTNKSINAFNSDRRKTNTSGVTGVWWRKDTNRWSAEIKKDGKKISLGCFGSFEEAVEARKKAEVAIYGF